VLFWLIPGRYRLKYVCVIWSIAVGVFAVIYWSKAWGVGDSPRLVLYSAAFLVSCAMAILARVPTFLAGLIVVGGLFGYDFYMKSLDTAALRPIAEVAATMVKSGGRSGASGAPADSPAVPGKIVVWDMTKNRLSDAHYLLPASLRATAQDQAMTVFLLSNIESRQVDTYYKVGEASVRGPGTGWGAYRDTATLAVVTWPGPRLVGWHSVVGDAPAKKISLHWGVAYASDQHGALSQPIAQWIRMLPGVPASPARTPVTLLAFVPSTTASAPSAAGFAPTGISSSAPTVARSPGAWTEATAQKEALHRYPQLGVPNSPMNRAFVARYQQLKAKDPSYLRDPSWPLHLADEIAQQGVNR
jgi:hypothetical protein